MLRNYHVNGKPYAVEVDPEIAEIDQSPDPAKRRPLLFCSSGDFPLYDAFLYDQMTNDRPRTELYEKEIRGQVAGKTVVDIGTGAHANWAVLAAESGASKVYGIEAIEASYRSALEVVRNSPYSDRIELIYGLSTEVKLPERVDICISEILGCPTSSEGVAAVLSDARERFLKDTGSFIIEACTTKIAACRLSDEFRDRLGIHESDITYLRNAFSAVGRPFDIRVVIESFPEDWIVSTEGVAERLCFNEEISTSQSTSGILTLTSDTRVDGIAGWINVVGGPNSGVLDTLRTTTTWLPIFYPVFYPGINLKKGDQIRYTASTFLSSGRTNPDYSIIGSVFRNDESIMEFEFNSPFVSERYRGDEFYSSIFPE